jgi:pimeloyl-ACP methyl ester carboxylesterase
MGFTYRWGLRRGMPDELVEHTYSQFDHGTQRAILKLYRASPPEVLAAAGESLGAIRAPALVMSGAEDSYIPPRFGDAYGEALGGEALVEQVDGGDHWFWLSQPETVHRVTDFLRV